MTSFVAIKDWLHIQSLPASLATLREGLLFAYPLPSSLDSSEEEPRRLLDLLDAVIKEAVQEGKLCIRGDHSLPVTMIIAWGREV